jgi:uncharacterized protein YidB (DUF937 family)
MSRGFPSMTALLGLLAVAGYQNRDKIAEMLGGIGQSTPGGAGQSPPGGARQSPPGGAGQSGISGLLGQLSRTLGGASAGGILSGGLGELVERFNQSGHGETAQSWVGTGPNKPVAPPQLEQAIGPEVLGASGQSPAKKLSMGQAASPSSWKMPRIAP